MNPQGADSSDSEPEIERGDAEDPSRGPAPAVKRIRKRQGIALCLSGGGFRAAIFHLGALTRLNELGLLAQVRTFSCVSGGSIVGGLLAQSIAHGMSVTDGRYDDWPQFSNRLLEFVRQDIRTRPVLAHLALWRCTRGRAARRLQKHYESLLGTIQLGALPQKPRFIFCGTDLVYANLWVAERWRVGDYKAGYVIPPPPHWTLAKAVAASSCFPPIFTPLPTDIRSEDYKKPSWTTKDEFEKAAPLRRKIRLTNGGVYNNLGVEPLWRGHRLILVSDGGKPLQSKHVPPGLRLMRYSEVIQNQVNSLRRRWLIDTYKRAELTGVDESTFSGTYWGISRATERYTKSERPEYGYSKLLADAVIANVRTDLDPLSPNEIQVLMKHGYELADVATQTHLADVEAVPFPEAPLRAWPDKLRDEAAVRLALAGSIRRRLVRVSLRHHADNLVQITQPS